MPPFTLPPFPGEDEETEAPAAGTRPWNEEDEKKFREWYAKIAAANGLNPDPDEAHQFYDYRAAYMAGAEPTGEPGQEKHWPSEYKQPGHPNRYVEGVDTITGLPEQPMDTAINTEYRKAALTPRAFKRLPPKGKSGFVLPPFPGEEGYEEEEEQLTVSQMPGVIPQEEVDVDAAHPPRGGITGLAHRFVGRPLSRFGLRSGQAAGTLLETNVADVLPQPFSGAAKIAGTTIRALTSPNVDITVGSTGLPGDIPAEQSGEFRSELLGSQEQGFTPRLIESVVENLPQFATNIGMRAIAGPAGGILYSYVAEKGGAYDEFLQKGHTKDEADAMSTWSGGINALLEQVMPGATGAFRGLKPFTRGVARMLVGAGLEGSTEGFQSIVPDIVAATKDGNWQPLYDRFGKEQIDELFLEMSAGAVMGGPTAPYIGAKQDVGRDIEDAAVAVHAEAVKRWEERLAQAREVIARDREFAARGQGIEASAEELVGQAEAAQDVYAEEQEREAVRASLQQQQERILSERGARTALEQEAQFPFAPGAVQPTEGKAPEALLAAEAQIEQERAATAKQAKTAADFPFLPQAMRERVAPGPPVPEALPEPPPPARTAQELQAEAYRRAAEQQPVGPPAPSPAITEAQGRIDWRGRLKNTFNLTDEQVAESEAWMQTHGVTQADVVPGGELEGRMVNDLFQTTRYKRKGTPHDLPAGYVPYEFNEEKGHYAGASHIKTPEQLKAVQDEAERLAIKGTEGRHFYTKSKRFVGERSETPESAHQLSQTISITSPRNNVRQNLVDAARARVQAAFGVPLEARDFAGIPKKLSAVYGGVPYEMGRKTYNFGENIAGDLERFTGDIWQQRVYGYQPKWSEKNQKWEMPAPTDAEYDFMEHDARRIATKLGWPVAEVQAAQWAAKKSEDEGNTVEVAAQDYEDYASDPTILAHVSYESKPGTSTNHLPEMYSAPERMQEAFHLANRRAAEDENGIDIALRRFGLLQARSLHGTGLYSPETGPRKGELLVSPGTQLRAIAPSKLGDTLTLDPATVMAHDAAASAMAIAFSQDAVPWHAPTSGGKLRDARIADIRFARALSKAEQIDLVAKVKAELQKAGFKGWEISVPMPGPTGVRLLNLLGPNRGKKGKIIKGGLHGGQFAKIMRNVARSMGPDAEVVLSSGQLGRYFENNWGESANGEGHYQNGSAGRSDVQDAIRSYVAEVLPRAQRVSELAAELYGWTPNRNLHPEFGWKPLRGDDAFDAQVRDILQSGLEQGGGSGDTSADIPAEARAAAVAPSTDTLFQGGPTEFPPIARAERLLQELEDEAHGEADYRGMEVSPEEEQRFAQLERARKLLERAKTVKLPARPAARIAGPDARERLLSSFYKILDAVRASQPAQEERARNLRGGKVREHPAVQEGIWSRAAANSARWSADSAALFQRNIDEIEATPGWKFDPKLREDHAVNKRRLAATDWSSTAMPLSPEEREFYKGDVETERLRLREQFFGETPFGQRPDFKLPPVKHPPGEEVDPEAIVAAHEGRRERLEFPAEERAETVAKQRVRASNKEGLQTKTAKGRERLAAIEAQPSWRFDPALREEHARITKGIKLTQEMLDRGLYQGARGVAQFPEDGGPAVIRGLQNPDVSTAIHELTHVARRRLPEQDQRRLERIYGVRDGKWTREQEERFAEDAEKYYRGLKTPPKLARPMFDRVRDGLQKLYTRITQGDEAVADINPEVAKFFDERIIGAQAAAPAAAAPAPATRAPGASVGAVAQMLPEELTDLVEPGAVKRFFKKYFTKESLNPDSAYTLHETARSEMRGHVVDASQAAVDWYRAEKQDKKLGSRHQKADREALGRYLRGDQSALADISSEAGRAAATRMRGAINNMQNALLSSGMLEPGSAMRAKVESSIGTYITRQYKAFREPNNWNYESVAKKHNHLLTNAVKWVQGQLAAENGGVEPSEDDVKLRLKELFPDEADGNNPFALLDKVGKKDLSVFMQKKDVPEVLRKLLGEYEDPVVNFMQTYQHVAQVVVNHKMLTELKKVGLKEGWLSEKKTLTMDKEFVPGGAGYSPLAGLYGSQDAVDAWTRLTRPKEITSGLGRVTLRAMGGLRAAKTVYNPTTHFGNVIGNYPILLANGNWGAFGAKNATAWKVAWNSAFDDVSKSDEKIRALASKLTRLGVIQQSIGASDLRDLIQETGGMGDVFMDPARSTANKVVGIFGRIAKIYGSEDDGPKTLAYLMEYAKYKQVFPNMPEEQLEQRVANIVKDTMPTWSRINPELRRIRRRLPFGNFASFSMEIVRTRVATHNLARKEIKTGAEMRARGKEIGNHELEAEGRRLERMGYRRAVSNVAVPLMFGGLHELSKALLGIDEEEEDKMQRGFAPWDRWTPKLYTGRPSKGRVPFISLAGIDPFGALKRPITAAIEHADDPVQAMRSGLAELIRPYTDTDFLTRFVIETAFARKFEDFGLPEWVEGKVPKAGTPLYKKDDPENWARFTKHVLDELSLYKAGKRLERSWEERVSETGQATGPGAEVFGMVTRLRPANLDWTQALKFRRKSYDEDLDEAKYFFTGPANRQGKADEKVIRTGLHSYVQQTIERQREIFLDIDAARWAGMTEDEILAALTDEEIGPWAMSKKLAERLMAGTIQISVPETKHGEPIYDELVETAGDIVTSYQKRYKEDGLTIELE